MIDQLIALLLIVAIWCGLFAGCAAYEKYRARQKRERFTHQIERYRSNG